MAKKSCGNCGETECEWYDHNYVEDDCAQWCSRESEDVNGDVPTGVISFRLWLCTCIGAAIVGVLVSLLLARG